MTDGTGERAPGARRRMPYARRREQLLRVALEEFGRRGYHLTQMEHVAAAGLAGAVAGSAVARTARDLAVRAASRAATAAVEAVLRELLRDALKLAMRDALRGVITDVARDIVVDVAKTTWITATRPAPAAAGGTVTVQAATGVRPAAGVRRPGVDVWAEATRDEDGRPPRDRAS